MKNFKAIRAERWSLRLQKLYKINFRNIIAFAWIEKYLTSPAGPLGENFKPKKKTK